jgi:hypothetical protein
MASPPCGGRRLELGTPGFRAAGGNLPPAAQRLPTPRYISSQAFYIMNSPDSPGYYHEIDVYDGSDGGGLLIGRKIAADLKEQND